MNYKIIPAENRQTGTWAGGTTEQLYIWPETAAYSNRDFAFRVSTAKVELDESDFTSLPCIIRWIMPLSGEMKLIHKGHGEVSLAPFAPHRFDGGWETRSFGRCTDFNLMLSAGWQGGISAEAGEYSCPDGGFVGVYAFGDAVEVVLSAPERRETVTLAPFDLLVLSGTAGLTLSGGQGAIFWVSPEKGQ